MSQSHRQNQRQNLYLCKRIDFDSHKFGGVRLLCLVFSIVSVLVLSYHVDNTSSEICKININKLLIYFNVLWIITMIGLSSWHSEITGASVVPIILFAFTSVCGFLMFIAMTILTTYYHFNYPHCYTFSVIYGLVELYFYVFMLTIVLILTLIYMCNLKKRKIRNVYIQHNDADDVDYIINSYNDI
jgi:hypothetical protein